MAGTIKKFLEHWTKADSLEGLEPRSGSTMLYEEQQEQLERDMSILGEGNGFHEERVHKKAEKEVRNAAEDSLKELHVIQKGRCPKCGTHLHQHLFSSICDECGWHTFETPRTGPVKVHLIDGADAIEGDKCYTVKTGAVLIMKNDVVFAKIPGNSVGWIEYLWSPEEVAQRHKQLLQKMSIRCGWCGEEVDPEKEGFHLTHVAFGATQERYCFCSDECYEEFRKLYPARVHRNCYERSCNDCDLCNKRYQEGGNGILMFMKDYLSVPARKK